MAVSNYGTTLSDSDGVIGELVTIDPPEYNQPEVESTNHSSGGVRQYISSKLAEMAPFKAVINYVIADIATLVTDMRAGTSKRYTIAYPSNGSQRFNAFPTAIKPMTADATKPETLKAEITFRPSDSLDLSS